MTKLPDDFVFWLAVSEGVPYELEQFEQDGEWVCRLTLTEPFWCAFEDGKLFYRRPGTNRPGCLGQQGKS